MSDIKRLWNRDELVEYLLDCARTELEHELARDLHKEEYRGAAQGFYRSAWAAATPEYGQLDWPPFSVWRQQLIDARQAAVAA